MTRTVWDGDQVLYEIRAKGSDADAAYVSGGAMESDGPTSKAESGQPFESVVYTYARMRRSPERPTSWSRARSAIVSPPSHPWRPAA